MDRASLSSALLGNRVVLIKTAAATGVFGEFFVETVEKMADILRFLPKYRDSSICAPSIGKLNFDDKIYKCINIDHI